MTSQRVMKIPLSAIYRNLFPWRILDEFVADLQKSIAYRSKDNSLIALSKPFGVGTFAAEDRNVSKHNQDKLLYRLSGRPRYCLQDALKPLADELKSPEPYVIIKGIDRYMSGLVLITNNPLHANSFRKSIQTTRVARLLPYGLRAITNGYPTLRSETVRESVGLELIEVDELGDHKEPVIVQNPSVKFNSVYDQFRSKASVELSVKKINRELSTSLLEVKTTSMKHDFVRCYISSKTSFVLGDVRFSKRIREVLGKKIQVSAFRSSHAYDSDYEPLNKIIRAKLGVESNAQIPLMLDLHKLYLKNFFRKAKEGHKDLTITSEFMPAHFAFTAKKLDLFDAIHDKQPQPTTAQRIGVDPSDVDESCVSISN